METGVFRMVAVVLLALTGIIRDLGVPSITTTTHKGRGGGYWGADAEQCVLYDYNQVMYCVFNVSDTQWTTPPGINALYLSLWGGGGGGSGTTYYGGSVDSSGDGYIYAFSSGGGSGSAIVDYPVEWEGSTPQTFHFTVGSGGIGGTGPSPNGGPGGQTTVTFSGGTFTAYGGGGGGTTSSTASNFFSMYAGGGGGAGGNAGRNGKGGPGYTNGSLSLFPSPDGPAGASSNQPTLSPSGVCVANASAGGVLGYWVSGGAGAMCNGHSGSAVGYSPVQCATSAWADNCLNPFGGCGEYYASGGISDDGDGFTIQNCNGAGAPGPLGNYVPSYATFYSPPLFTPSSGAGGWGCFTQVITNTNLNSHPSNCPGQNGADGGVLIAYVLPNGT